MAMFVMDIVEQAVMSAVGSPGRKRPDPRPYLEKARDALAEAVIGGKQIDRERMERVFHDSNEHFKAASERARAGAPRHAMLVWGNFISVLGDYLEGGAVWMRDGRVATADGWDYSNCEPEQIWARIPRALSERWEAHLDPLTTAAPSDNPERNPSEYDLIHDKFVTQALTEFLDKKDAIAADRLVFIPERPTDEDPNRHT